MNLDATKGVIGKALSRLKPLSEDAIKLNRTNFINDIKNESSNLAKMAATSDAAKTIMKDTNSVIDKFGSKLGGDDVEIAKKVLRTADPSSLDSLTQESFDTLINSGKKQVGQISGKGYVTGQAGLAQNHLISDEAREEARKTFRTRATAVSAGGVLAGGLGISAIHDMASNDEDDWGMGGVAGSLAGAGAAGGAAYGLTRLVKL